ncbi:MAG: hypothetical protein ACOC1F_02145 [Myxococcota bacterium]
MRWSSFIGAGLVVAASGCGGAARPADTPAASDMPADSQPASSPVAEEPPSSTGSDAEAPEVRGEAEEQLPRGGLSDDVADLYEQFRRAETALLDAGRACSRACRALRSMQRATRRMCELASTPAEEHRCDDARRRYRKARDRVRVTCQVCPEGPALDGALDPG